MKIVMLAAGFGSRLWPLSTPDRPKQFQPIIAGQSPLQYTSQLFGQLVAPDELYVLTLQGLEQAVSQQLPQLPSAQILRVPERRNTLPHALYALCSITASDDEPVLFVMVDHLIIQPDALIDSMRRILKNTQALDHVTLMGSRSKQFDPNAGYFTMDHDNRILSFKEKPTQQDIDRLAANGTMIHKDAAMLIASRRTLAAALASFTGEVSSCGQALLAASPQQRRQRFLDMPFIDIATGLYEKATNLYATFADGDFIDLGRFSTLYEVGAKDNHGNVVSGNVILDDASHDNYVFNQTERPLVVINTHNSVVVQGEVGTVVAPMSDINAVGEIYKAKIHPH
jgi:mannose-1-phosphate guanylyltransferase